MKNQKGFAQIILILVIMVVAIGGAYYFGTLKNKTIYPVASSIPSELSPTLKPSSQPLNQNVTLNLTGSLQDFMNKNCKPGNPQYLNSTDLPFKIDTNIIKLLQTGDVEPVYCSSTEINTVPIKNGYLGIRLKDNNGTINIYDDESEELGHGGPPYLGFFGQKVFDKDSVQIGVWLSGGDGPQILGYVGLGIRGIKKFTTKDGHSVYVNFTQTAIPGSDERLINQLKPFSSIDPNWKLNEPTVNYDKDVNIKIVNYFFSKIPDPRTPEGMAFQNIEKILSAITAK